MQQKQALVPLADENSPKSFFGRFQCETLQVNIPVLLPNELF